ncbi:DUF3368 domain-containing protein [Thiocapsa bogorovii]|uniref:DUF3368 domain-containing protein n=1 Tax=Thiocapsa bogorovii TaxID=521689 RepID=UPI0038CDBC4E
MTCHALRCFLSTVGTPGTIRVLLEAKQSGLIDSILQPLESMRENGYRIHEDSVQAAVRQPGEAF